jgi:hypothetical protein
MKDWAARKSLFARQRAIAGNDIAHRPIKDSTDGYDSGDDDYDDFIEDDQFHSTWGFLLHRKTGQFIGQHRIGEFTSFIKAGYIAMARIGKLEKSFTNLPLDTRIILVNALENAFYDYFAQCQSHQKALQALQEVGGQVGLGSLMKNYSGVPLPPTPSATPSGRSTPIPGSNTNPILVSDVSQKLQKTLPKVKSEPSTSSLPPPPMENGRAPTKRLSEEVEFVAVKRKKVAAFSNNAL